MVPPNVFFFVNTDWVDVLHILCLIHRDGKVFVLMNLEASKYKVLVLSTAQQKLLFEEIYLLVKFCVITGRQTIIDVNS